MKAKRFHPLELVFGLWNLGKSAVFLGFFLFVLKADSDAVFFKYGRMAFFLGIGISLVHILVKWLTQTYKIDQTAFQLSKGVFTKSQQTIPFSKIQNVTRQTTLFHRLFQVTSIQFETGISGEDAAVIFKVISLPEASRLEEQIKVPVIQSVRVDHENPIVETLDKVDFQRTIHFTPTKQDMYKATISSLSFLFLFPIIGSLYFKINEVFAIDEQAEGLLANILQSFWLLAGLIILLFLASAVFGLARTTLKYGNYEISSDSHYIYIKNGLIEEKIFSIAKDRVQSINIKQSPIKRLLGLAEVKLISAASESSEDVEQKTSSLYPFLPVSRAYDMISEVLPDYKITTKMTRLPKKSLWIRMLTPSWVWMIATALLYYFKPLIFGWEQAWWIGSVALFLVIMVNRLLNFFHTSYTLNDRFLQIKTGAWMTSLFVFKREKIMEVKISRNLSQQLFGLASIETAHRSKSIKHTRFADVPVLFADSFFKWYQGRK